MKKSITLLLCVILLFSVAVAETIDVKSLSDEELLTLKKQVLDEIAIRHLEDSSAFGQWYDFGLGKILPSPAAVFGRVPKRNSIINNNDDNWFAENLDDITHEEFEAYVAALRLYGFNDKISASGISFEADNAAGVHILVSLIGNVLFVDAKDR